MQTKNWHEKYSVDEFIKANYKELSFIELIKLIKLKFNEDINFGKLFNRLEIEPHLSLTFASSDVERFEEKNEKYFIETNFLALYGTSSPLPTFYTEDLLEEELEGETLLKDFYNIFNKRKYKQFFHAYLKYRLSNRIIENNETSILNILYSFIGQNYQEEFNNLKYFTKIELLGFAHLFLHTNRSKEGLNILISGLLGIKIIIVEFVKNNEKIMEDQLCIIGKRNCLIGKDTHLGDKILNITSTFKIILIDLDKNSFNYFQKKEIGYKSLEELINLYIGSSYKWIIEYRLHDNYKSTKLGNSDWSALGINSWINSNKGQ